MKAFFSVVDDFHVSGKGKLLGVHNTFGGNRSVIIEPTNKRSLSQPKDPFHKQEDALNS